MSASGQSRQFGRRPSISVFPSPERDIVKTGRNDSKVLPTADIQKRQESATEPLSVLAQTPSYEAVGLPKLVAINGDFCEPSRLRLIRPRNVDPINSVAKKEAG